MRGTRIQIGGVQMLNYEVCKNWKFEDIPVRYTERDTMLYALGIGMGAQATDAGQLRYVYEKDLQAVPTMAAVLGSPGSWMRTPSTGVDFFKVVHGEQDVRLFRLLPSQGNLIARSRVHSITDKGVGKGAVVVVLRELTDAASGELIAQIRQLTFLRGDGGFSAESGVSDAGPEALPAIEERPADVEISLASLEQAALIYRLSGDYNPLHADPEFAAKAGFARPILHGLCTYGMACHAVLRSLCDYDPRRFKRLATRFTSPVYPGETIRFQIWKDAPGLLRLRAHVDARGVIVLNNGVVELA